MTRPPSKNQVIKATLIATKARRKTQVCRVYQLKINRRKLNATSREHFTRLFLEAKWFYNWILSHPGVFNVETTVQTVPVKVGDAFEERNTVMPVETKTTTQRMVDHFNGLSFVRASFVREAGSFGL
ncbi:MAG: hypothetical protein ACFFB3_10940 [Candidatus Hodarchaeota archaeon]